MNWPKPLTMLAVLFLVGSLPWEEVLPNDSSRGSGEQTFRILSANISTCGPQAEGFLRSSEVGRFQTVALAEHLLGVNSNQHIRQAVEADWLPRHCSNSETVRKFDQRYIRRNSIATRNQVALAAWSAEKSDVRGRSLWF